MLNDGNVLSRLHGGSSGALIRLRSGNSRRG
jgi:hypothetical protein